HLLRRVRHPEARSRDLPAHPPAARRVPGGGGPRGRRSHSRCRGRPRRGNGRDPALARRPRHRSREAGRGDQPARRPARRTRPHQPVKTRRRIYLIAAGVIALSFGVFFWAPEFLKTVETKLYDLHFTLRGVRSPGDRVAIAAIDEKSLAAIGRWPWPRSVLAQVIRTLSEGGARVIAVDILLSEPEVSGESRAAAYLSQHWSEFGLS